MSGVGIRVCVSGGNDVRPAVCGSLLGDFLLLVLFWGVRRAGCCLFTACFSGFLASV
jgi:hypothetical protein